MNIAKMYLLEMLCWIYTTGLDAQFRFCDKLFDDLLTSFKGKQIHKKTMIRKS